jgi:hypothetical protein
MGHQVKNGNLGELQSPVPLKRNMCSLSRSGLLNRRCFGAASSMKNEIAVHKQYQILTTCEFGERVAEEEADALSEYFVETENWKNVFSGTVDIIYGPKGAGKSALYSLLVHRTDELFDRGTILVAGENPRGTPAFQNLSIAPPESEEVFVSLWKLYLLTLLNNAFSTYGVTGTEVDKLRTFLEGEGLADVNKTLGAYVQGALDYVQSFFSREVKAVEAGLTFDAVTQLPNGVSGKITFKEPGRKQREKGFVSIDELFVSANSALEDAGFDFWILLDRLDVAFAENSELEKNALRALFRAYLDLLAYKRIHLKVFLRTDIWTRIIEEGFREASHITRHVTISWNDTSVMNLIIRRFLRNKEILEGYEIDADRVLRSAQEISTMFYRICPEQVDVGEKSPRTFKWLLSRTSDATGVSSPREIIHFLNALKSEQLKRYENGINPPGDERLFERVTFKEALPEVSTVRLEQTLYAEHPEKKKYIEALRESKTDQSSKSLAATWGIDVGDAQMIAEELVAAGFFEKRGGNGNSRRYWIPFLYRDSLNLSQGAAD